MTFRAWFVGVCILAALPLVAPLPGACERPDSPTVRLSGSHLSVEARGVAWAQLLDELRRQTGIILRFATRPGWQVTASFRDLPIERALRRLFGPDANFLYVYGGDGHEGRAAILPAEVWVIDPGESALDAAMAPPAAAGLIEYRVAQVRAAAEEAEAADEAVVPALLGFLRDPLPPVRKEAVAALGELRDEAASVMDALTELLVSDPDADVRWTAADALGRIRSHRALDALRQALEDRQVVVQTSAVEAIAQIGGARAEAILRQAVGRVEVAVAEAIEQVLQDAR